MIRALKSILLLLLPAAALAALIVVVSGAFPYKVYAVTSGSMTPTIPSKSAVLVQENDYEIGQVITFTTGEETVTHRLISVDADGLATTKGDGNETDDPWQIPTSQIIGGVISAPPQLGYWLIYMKNPLGMASIIMSVMLFWQVWTMTKPDNIALEESTVTAEAGHLSQPSPVVEAKRLRTSSWIDTSRLEIGGINQAGQRPTKHLAALSETGPNQRINHIERHRYRWPVMTV